MTPYFKKYTKQYTGYDPQLTEADIFRTVIILTAQVTAQAVTQTEKILAFCRDPKTREEILIILIFRLIMLHKNGIFYAVGNIR